MSAISGRRLHRDSRPVFLFIGASFVQVIKDPTVPVDASSLVVDVLCVPNALGKRFPTGVIGKFLFAEHSGTASVLARPAASLGTQRNARGAIGNQ